jgi:hypothetical protein
MQCYELRLRGEALICCNGISRDFGVSWGHIYIVTNGGVAWLTRIKRGFGMESGLIHFAYNHLEQFLPEPLISTAVHWVPLGATRTDGRLFFQVQLELASTELKIDPPLNCLSTFELPPTILLNSFLLFCCCVIFCPVLFCSALFWGLAYSVLACTAKELPIATLAEATADSLPWERESVASLVPAVVVSYPGYLPMSGYWETCHYICIYTHTYCHELSSTVTKERLIFGLEHGFVSFHYNHD